jgi:hypothetical protein
LNKRRLQKCAVKTWNPASNELPEYKKVENAFLQHPVCTCLFVVLYQERRQGRKKERKDNIFYKEATEACRQHFLAYDLVRPASHSAMPTADSCAKSDPVRVKPRTEDAERQTSATLLSRWTDQTKFWSSLWLKYSVGSDTGSDWWNLGSAHGR